VTVDAEMIIAEHDTLAVYQGTLKGFDQTINLILSGCQERVYSPESGIEVVQMGLYIVRGDNV